VQDKRKRVLVISTGSKSVDGMLGGKPTNYTHSRFFLHGQIGGIMSQSLTEGKYSMKLADIL
jgi:hypothetical protein